MGCDYKTCKTWAKILGFIGAGVSIALGVAKMFKIMDEMDPIDYITNIYMM